MSGMVAYTNNSSIQSLRQENNCELKTNLKYIRTSRPNQVNNQILFQKKNKYNFKINKKLLIVNI